ncbi:MAG TPA: hypothetical protein VJ725_21480 [Thermoanaerobaculia bacterium]|nr:hypothetical protein [Thermoanaerobaculia bacterium]
MKKTERFGIKVVWRNGEEEFLCRGICANGPIARFPSREAADAQRAFLLEGMSDEVQSINVVPLEEGVPHAAD